MGTTWYRRGRNSTTLDTQMVLGWVINVPTITGTTMSNYVNSVITNKAVNYC